MSRESYAELVLRIGLAFAFLYPPINAAFDPNAWIGYFPPFVRGYVDDMIMLHAFGAIEVIIALWMLWGKKLFWPASAAFVMLVAIVVMDYTEFQVVFRDLSIAAIALYFCVKYRPGGNDNV
ncbi:MAG: hypothetical protein KBD06_01615 [Candidatus Pacebacteria bacterium]|nr:hypothetical protein [Candidatus Paceibacterota bacterium]